LILKKTGDYQHFNMEEKTTSRREHRHNLPGKEVKKPIVLKWLSYEMTMT